MKRWFLSTLLAPAAVLAAAQGMALIPEGAFVLPFRKDTAAIRMKVDRFRLDKRAVTVSEFRDFTLKEPAFSRPRIRRMFADSGYLSDWKNESKNDAENGSKNGSKLDPLPPAVSAGSADAPVTRVSWFAAKAYCASQGKRLPTTAEWEWAAKSLPPGLDSAGLHQAILDWYSRPQGGARPAAGSGSLSGHGVRDLFGSVWEWTSDFDAFGFTGFNQRGVEDSSAFCGAGSARATKEADYAANMRWAFRLSLRPDYTVGSLGFRCAADAGKKDN